MSFEPRMRGTRFRRRAPKKRSTKEKREGPENSVFHQERTPVDPSTVSARVLNALDHLGTQRFALPPFSEHFDRWIKDVRTILADLETELPEVIDQLYNEDSEQILSEAQEGLRKLVDAEQENSDELSKLHQELTSCELELSNLEHEYKTNAHEARNDHNRSLQKIRGEIESLDKQRLKLLRKKPSILDRILHRPRTNLEGSMRALETKRIDMGSKQRTLEEKLDTLRSESDIRMKEVSGRRDSLKAKLTEYKAHTSDDAVDLRNQACHKLSQTVSEAIGRMSKTKVASGTENIQ